MSKAGFNPEAPIDQDYMFIITGYSDGETINFYLGKNDEESSPPLWQVWLEEIIRNIDDAADIEWDI